MRIELSKTYRFEAAHRLPKVPEGHKCARLHGHSYHIDVYASGEVDPEMGWLVDYGEMTEAWNRLIGCRLDHYYLNDIEGLENPTAEILAKWIFDRLKSALPSLCAVRVHETCTSSALYKEEK